MDEAEIFGVRIPDSDTHYFVSIMGSEGIAPGLAAYEGTQGLAGFWELHQPQVWMRPEELLVIPHLKVLYEDREDVDAEERKKMKALGFHFRGKNGWPVITYVHSGMMPMMPEEPRLNDLVIVMEQALDVMGRLQQNPELIFADTMDQEMYLIRAREQGSQGQWKDTYSKVTFPRIKYPMTYNPLERDKVARLPRSKETLQADIVLMNNPVAEPGKKAYFPFTFLMMSKNTGRVEAFELLSPMEGLQDIYRRFPGLLIKGILKMGFQPEALELRHPILLEMARQMLFPSRVKVVRKNPLEHIEEILERLQTLEED